MVESDNRPKNPLLEEVTKIKEKQVSEAKAQEMLPVFKTQLGDLITKKVAPPEVITVKITKENFLRRRYMIDDDDDDDECFGFKGRKLATKLTAIIPLENGKTTSVTISASGYPEVDNPNSAKDLSYEIDVHELDRVLIIKGFEAIMQSKTWESEPFTMHTPIGVRLSSWPSWSRKSTAEDIQEYQTLLESMNQKGVIFEGSTPPIINEDFSEIRKQLKIPKSGFKLPQN